MNPNGPQAQKPEDVLWLTIHSASGLGAADSSGASDPYVIVFFDNEELGETAVKLNTLNPVWNDETFVLVFPDFEASNGEEQDEFGSSEPDLRIEVYDHDDFGRGDFLGEIVKTGNDLMAMCAASLEHEKVELPLCKKPHRGRQRLVQGNITMTFSFGQRKPTAKVVQHFPFSNFPNVDQKLLLVQTISPENLKVICDELLFDASKECPCISVAVEFLEHMCHFDETGEACWGSSWAQVELNEDGKTVDEHDRTRAGSNPLRKVWYNSENEQQLDIHPLTYQLRQKVHQVRAREQLLHGHTLGRWTDRWWAFAGDAATNTEFYYHNFSTSISRRSPPNMLYNATCSTQRNIRGFLGRRKFLKKKRAKEQVAQKRREEDIKRRRIGMSAEARLADEAEELAAEEAVKEKEREAKLRENKLQDMKNELRELSVMETQELWQKGCGDR